MPTVTLLTKAYDDFQLKLVNRNLRSTLKGLNVETKICGLAPRNWVQIAVSGEDEKIALHHLADEIGLCPTHLEQIGKFSTIKGRITSLNKSSEKICVDIGIFSPNIMDATIPVDWLQAQLVDGRKIALKKLVELFGFCENLPLTAKISTIDREKSLLEATLAEKQVSQYRNWTKSLLDRLIILGASLYDVKLAVKIAGFSRDVIIIEPLGLLEHAIVCKLGTDAVGLIPKIGRKLKKASFTVFNPKKVLKFLEYPEYSLLSNQVHSHKD
jgi:hypothetical protein